MAKRISGPKSALGIKVGTRRIHYVTFRQLVEDTLSLVAKLPPHITAVAGVPRSGMFPASMIATILHLPLFAATPHGLVRLGHGRRLAELAYEIGNCLVIDDSAHRGRSMARAVDALGLPRGRIVTAVVYAHPWCLRRAGGGIDIAERVIPSLRLFEWNLLNRPMASKMMCDIDGVICRNSKVPDDDGDNYAAALDSAPPFHLPRRGKVNTLITHRLERWREITCRWLTRFGVKYRNLVMAPQLTAAQRRAEMRPNGRWKGAVFQQSSCQLFIESSRSQALEIHRTSGKAVLCIETGSVYQ